MNHEFKDAIAHAGLRPTSVAKELEDTLRRLFGWKHRYQPARLAIGRSLSEGSAPPMPGDIDFATSIPGNTLFGDRDLDTWLTILITDGNLAPDASPSHLKTAIEAHWHNGALLLRDDLETCKHDRAAFVRRLANLLPDTVITNAEQSASFTAKSGGGVNVKIGSISKSIETGEAVSVNLTEQSTSPHMALMGKTRRGKTYTAVQIADSVVHQSGAPLLFIDPKKEYVENGKLSTSWPGNHIQPEVIRVGQYPIPLDFLPMPGIGTQAIGAAAVRLGESIANCCQGAGAVQRSYLRDAIAAVAKRESNRGLVDVRAEYDRRLQQEGKTADSVLGQLDVLSQTLHTFEPKLSPAEFFSRSWYLSLDMLPGDEPQRLIMLLLMDAMVDHFLAADNTPTHNGQRQLRSVVLIDEARRILKQKKLDSLSRLVREGASKGLSIMLLSQDPSDFDGQADDFTTQLGTVVAYGCNQSPRGLKALSGAFGRKLQPQEFADDQLPRGVAFCKLPERQPERIQAWQPKTD